MFLFEIILTALVSSLFTLAMVRWWLKRQGAPLWEDRLDALHESIAQTVEVRVKRAVIESLSEASLDSASRAPKPTSELIADSLQAVLARRRKV